MLDIETCLVIVRVSLGLVAVVLMVLVTYGFRHAISIRAFTGWMWDVRGASPSELLRASLTTYHIKGIIRLGIWDVLIFAMAAAGWVPFAKAAYISAINIPLALLAILGSVLALGAQYKTIPEDERHHFCWVTAPFYPWRRLEAINSAGQRASEPVEDDVSELEHRVRNLEAQMQGLSHAVLDHPERARMLAAAYLKAA